MLWRRIGTKTRRVRARVSRAIADAMIRVLTLSARTTVLDHGTGTGVVALRFQPLVREVIAADSSPGMLDVLRAKVQHLGLHNVRAVQLDLEHGGASAEELRLDVIVSAMTLYHIEDISSLAASFCALLPNGGQVAIADLDLAAGDFHADNTGVFHHGFARFRGRLPRVSRPRGG